MTYTAVVPFDDAKATLEAPNHRILGSSCDKAHKKTGRLKRTNGKLFRYRIFNKYIYILYIYIHLDILKCIFLNLDVELSWILQRTVI